MSEKENASNTFRRTVRIVTGVAAALHFVQAFIALGVSLAKDTRFKLVQNYASWPKEHTEAIVFAQTNGGTLNLKYLIVSFFLLSALFQGIPTLITPVWIWLYNSIQYKGIQPFRWVEYAASASVLLLACAAVNGVNDLHFLLILFFTNATIMMLGLVQEVFAYVYLAAKGVSGHIVEFLLPHLVGWLAYIPIWAVLMTKFALASKHSEEAPPPLIVALYACNIIAFTSFGLVQLVEMVYIYKAPERRGVYAVRAELAYTVLSFIAKTSTAWFFFGGVVSSSVFAKPA